MEPNDEPMKGITRLQPVVIIDHRHLIDGSRCQMILLIGLVDRPLPVEVSGVGVVCSIVAAFRSKIRSKRRH